MRACQECWHRNASLCDKCLILVFRAWGKFVASHPLITIILSSILAASTIYFVFDLETEDSLEELYVPKHTQSWNNMEKYSSTWGEYDYQYEDYRWSNIIFTQQNKNVYTVPALLELQKLNEFISDNMTFVYNDKTYAYSDICYKDESQYCYTRCVLEFYDFNASIISHKFSLNQNNKYLTYPFDYSPHFEELVLMTEFIGQTPLLEPIQNQNGNDTNNSILISTPAFSCEYHTDYMYSYDLLTEWEYALTQYLNQYNSKNNQQYRVSHYTDSSFDDEFSRAIGSDTISFISSFVCLAIFSTVILLRLHRQKSCWKLCPFSVNVSKSRVLMGIIGIISSSLAIGSAFGIVGGILKIPFNPVVSVSPFLLVGLGIDDMFVLLRSYDLTDDNLLIQNRIILTLERGGISILFTSLTDLVAFCVGSTSKFPAVSAFCIYCGVGVFLDFVFQCSFFLGFMVIDSRYQMHKSCRKPTVNEVLNEEQIESESGKQNKTQELVTSMLTINETNDFDYNLPSVLSENSIFNRSQQPINELQGMINTESASKIMQILGDAILYNNSIKCVILLMFGLYLFGAIYGILSIDIYQDPIDLMPNDSYLRDYYRDSDTYFNNYGDSMMFVFDTPLDYSNKTTLQTINEFTEKVENNECFEYAKETQSWIKQYQLALEQYNVSNYNNSQYFYMGLFNYFLTSNESEFFKYDIWTTIINPNYRFVPSLDESALDYKYIINRSRIWLQTIPTGSGTAVLTKCLSSFQQLTAEYSDALGVYYWDYMTIYSESDKIVLRQTIYNLSYAVMAAFVITVILIPYPFMSLFVMVSVGQILVGILGYMSLWGLPINTNTMINVVISVGFSVDNAAHICHSYMNAPINDIKVKIKNKKQERKVRIVYALNAVGIPIISGDLSTIIAILPLLRAESEIFTSFFKVLFLVMLFGIAHAVFYLPVVLSIIGPTSLFKNIKRKEKRKKADIQLESAQQSK